MTEVNALFTQAFTQVSKYSPSVYANLLRFAGVVLVFIACAFAVSHFLNAQAKREDEFMFNLATRIMKVIFGVTLIVLLFKP
ncbi:hypothetical protein ACQUW5_14075 [Legionella sp. CNM-1927-20]|uniref:hypothetical protein n=1 Tax=Legionella sp. CNM-1927-20 TaxID=3422221 RepID=UPI00403ABCB7